MRFRHFGLRLTVFVFCSLAALSAQSRFDTPKAALDAYLQACREGDYQAAEACYTESSRKYVAQRTDPEVPRNPDLLRQFYQRMADTDFRLEQVNSKRAVFWPEDETIPPFLLRIQKPEEGWRLDYHFMSNYIKVKDSGWSWANPKIFGLWKQRE